MNPAERPVLETRIVSGEGGGPDKTILNTPRFLQGRGYPTTCAYFRNPHDAGFAALERRAAAWQAPLVAVDDFGALDVGVFRRAVELCRTHRPAIWHGHDYKTNLLGLWAARSVPMKLVTTVHGWVKHTWKTPLYYAVDRRCLKRYAAVVCVSQDLFDECQRIGVPAERLHLVLNGVDTEEFRRRRSPAEAKAALGLPTERLLIGAVGRLSYEKGFDLLIRAAAELLAGGVDFALHIVGEGDERPKLEALIRELGVGERVQLSGFQANLADVYEPLDAFVLSSRREGLPNVVLEAMAFGLPILATKIAGVPQALTDEESGLLVAPESQAELQSGLRRLLADGDLRRRLGEHARTTVEKSFSFARRMDRIVEIYDGLFRE